MIGAPEVEILANDAFKEFAPAQGTIEDLVPTDFELKRALAESKV